MKVLSIDSHIPGQKRVEAIDRLLCELGDIDRQRALALFLGLEVSRSRIEDEEHRLGHVTDETRATFFEQTDLLESLFNYLYEEKGENRLNEFYKVY